MAHDNNVDVGCKITHAFLAKDIADSIMDTIDQQLADSCLHFQDFNEHCFQKFGRITNFETDDQENDEGISLIHRPGCTKLLPSWKRSADGQGIELESKSAEDETSRRNSIDDIVKQSVMEQICGENKQSVEEISFDSRMAKEVDARFKQIMGALVEMNKKDSQFDCDSVQTEDIEKEFRKSLIFAVDEDSGTYSQERIPGPRMRPGGSCSDLDSVVTEDYESRFQDVMVMQTPNAPIRNIDRFIIDNDLDMIESRALNDKFRLSLENLSEHSLETSKPRCGSSSLHPTGSFQQQRTSNEQIYGDQFRFGRDFSRSGDLELSEEEKALGVASARIRSELEAEGYANQQRRAKTMNTMQAKSASGGQRRLISTTPSSQEKLGIVNKVDLEISLKLQKELARLKMEVKDALRTKQIVSHSVKRLENVFTRNQQDVRNLEKQLKDARMMTEDVRTDLKLAEFKRDSALAELKNVETEIENRRHTVQKLASQEQEWSEMANRQIYDRLRNEEFFKSENERKEKECNELQKEEWSKEKAILESKILLLENKNKETWSKERAVLESKIEALEKNCQEIEREKDEFIAEKNQEYDDIKREIQDKLEQSKDQSVREVGDLKRKMQDLSMENQTKQLELNRLGQQNSQLMEQIACLQQELNTQSQLRDTIVEENVKSLKILIKEKEHVVSSMKAQLEHEIQSREDQLMKAAHEKQQLESSYLEKTNMLDEHLQNKGAEIAALKERIGQQGEWLKQLSSGLTEETYNKFHALMNEEKERWEVEKEDQLSGQMETMKDEMVRTVRQLREELENERNLTHTYLQQIENLKEQMNDIQLSSSRLSAMQQTVQEDILNNENEMKDKQNKESIVKLKHLNDNLKAQIEDLKSKNKEMKVRNERYVVEMEKKELKQLDRLNLECQKMSDMLNLTGVKDDGHQSKPSRDVPDDAHAAMSTSLTSLSNLVEELRSRLTHQTEESLRQTEALKSQMRSEVDRVQAQLQDEKRQALDVMKDRLIKEHLREVDKLQKSMSGDGKGLYNMLKAKDRELCEIQRNMNAWKEQTALKLAQKFKQELNKELEKHLRKCRVSAAGKKLSAQADGSKSSDEKEYSSNGRLFEKPETKPELKNTKKCDISSGRGWRGSSPNLFSATSTSSTSPDKSQVLIRQLQLQVQRAENSSRLAEERANSSEHLLSEKLVEMSKLQGVLTRQTKELMQLQRAYCQIQNKT